VAGGARARLEGAMRIRLLVALVLLAVSAGVAGARTVESVSIKGAYGVIVVPDDWNGGLFLYAHGYSADKTILRPIPESLQGVDSLLIPGIFIAPPGYATATTAFRSVGWYMTAAVNDVENLWRYLVQQYGKPQHPYNSGL